MNRRLLAVVQAVTTAVLLVLLLRDFDWMAFRALYAALPAQFYGTSLAVVVAGVVMYAWRWRTLLAASGVQLPFPAVLRQYVIGVFMNNFFPSTVGGDAVKVFNLGRTHGYTVIARSVVLDRLLGVGVLAVLAAVVLWLEPIDDSRYVAARVALTAIAAGFVGVVVLTVFGSRGLPARVQRFGRLAVGLATHLQRFRIDLARAVVSRAVWGYSVATVFAYMALLTVVYQDFIALQTSVRPGFLATLMAIGSLAVLSNVPISVNGIGLREHLHVLLLEPLGVPQEVAVAISLLLFGHLLLVSLAGCLAWWQTAHAVERRSGETATTP